MTKPFIAIVSLSLGIGATLTLNRVMLNFDSLEESIVDLASQAYFYGCISQDTSRKACQLETEKYNSDLKRIYE